MHNTSIRSSIWRPVFTDGYKKVNAYKKGYISVITDGYKKESDARKSSNFN